MDIAMDVSSAVHELHINNSQMAAKELFHCGMNVGRDVMGTMSATLILAFFGGSLGIWVMDYVYDLPYLQLINSNSIGIEIMQSVAGSFGIILTVPLSAAFSAWLPFYFNKEK
jgi:Predicted multitransmembrane protein